MSGEAPTRRGLVAGITVRHVLVATVSPTLTIVALGQHARGVMDDSTNTFPVFPDAQTPRASHNRYREAQHEFETAAEMMDAQDLRRTISFQHARAAERKSNYYQSQEVKEIWNRAVC